MGFNWQLCVACGLWAWSGAQHEQLGWLESWAPWETYQPLISHRQIGWRWRRLCVKVLTAAVVPTQSWTASVGICWCSSLSDSYDHAARYYVMALLPGCQTKCSWTPQFERAASAASLQALTMPFSLTTA